LRVATPTGADALQVMTIHQAKGLEFPVVILPFMDTPLSPSLRDKIWFPLQHTPLESLHWSWINFSNQLELFGQVGQQVYESQKTAKILDALNVLYVALTRAQNQLYIITHEGEATDTPKSYADLFQHFAANQGVKLEESVPLVFGTPLANSKQGGNLENTAIQINSNLSDQWRKNLIVPQSFNKAVEKAKKEGILIHELLAKISNKERLDEILEAEIEKGNMEIKIKEKLKKQLNKILLNPELSSYFESNDQVFCEKELLMPNGLTLRPDRINISANGSVTVLDYKTGDYSEAHEMQLETYTEALKQLGFDRVASKLVYIGETIEVKTMSEF
jgi:ATP-dependent exoDNAse (exonuclease V) beta subunit